MKHVKGNPCNAEITRHRIPYLVPCSQSTVILLTVFDGPFASITSPSNVQEISPTTPCPSQRELASQLAAIWIFLDSTILQRRTFEATTNRNTTSMQLVP